MEAVVIGTLVAIFIAIGLCLSALYRISDQLSSIDQTLRRLEFRGIRFDE